MVIDTGHVYRRTVGEVSAVSQVKTHECVTGLQACHEHCHIGLRARVRLHIGELSPVEFLETVDGKLLHLVHYLAAAIVAGSGITFSIFVSQARAECGQNVVADKVFRGDQLYSMKLSALFFLDKF